MTKIVTHHSSLITGHVMDPELWQQVNRLFQAALALDPNDRGSFLDRACKGDLALRREVESLIASHDSAGSFIESPAYEAAPELLADSERGNGRMREALRANATISHYRILSLLGAGGMGEVYLAQDTTLDRQVAIKLLPPDVAADPERKRRFLREAKAASALNHPNVCIIYEVGETQNGQLFIVMEYVQGRTLQAKIAGDPLDTAELLEIGLQAADAIDAAHAKGITHRDIKPANLMLTPRGQVKVLDFGLAKIAGPAMRAVDTDIGTPSNTEPGVVMGTVQYMSPEQALGRDVDHRSDLFSLGVVLYEMATGRLPFPGGNAGEMIERIIHAQPEAIARLNYNLPTELERIVRKCLEKDRDRRYQSARELTVDLKNLQRDSDAGAVTSRQKSSEPRGEMRRLAIAALVLGVLAAASVGLYLAGRSQETAIDSVAVLPFVNANADPNLEYLAEGIPESITNSLSQLPRLKVMSSTSAFRFKGRETDVKEAGQKLGVRSVLTGKVAQRGDALAISIELVDVRDYHQIWGQQYNRKLADVFAIQDEMAREISDKLRLKLSGAERQQLARRPTENIQAFQYYVQGRSYINRLTRENLLAAVSNFEKAIEEDHNFALAYAELALVNQALAARGQIAPVEGRRKAREAISRALALDANLAEAHYALGQDQTIFVPYDFSSGDGELRRAIEFSPSLATAHYNLGNSLLRQGRLDESSEEYLKARELDPLNSNVARQGAAPYYFKRDYARALELLRQANVMGPPLSSTFEIGIYLWVQPLDGGKPGS